ncbi:autophagy-related protein 16-1 [Archocentrus centrarchus]|uniref:autophagy-related protein 16-1 n=1 Tax=Archocentrus centrarchus TaxID=63155 RepID=UPI0011E9BC5A|nr:autophagy-related protein 16-1-like [Archocentrus centrarchus]
MGSWKDHVRSGLQQRDRREKLPFVGVFTSLSQLEERFELREQILADVQSQSSESDEVEGNARLLRLKLRESEHLVVKLSQTVSDLTTVLYLKEAELQYWQSRVSQFRQEALTLAKGSNTLKATLSEFEFTVECQSKELATLRVDHQGLKEALADALTEKERLLQRWMEEKMEEADRLNKYNITQERWQHLTKHLRKHLQKDVEKKCVHTLLNSSSDAAQSTSAIRKINITTDMHSGLPDLSHISGPPQM